MSIHMELYLTTHLINKKKVEKNQHVYFIALKKLKVTKIQCPSRGRGHYIYSSLVYIVHKFIGI